MSCLSIWATTWAGPHSVRGCFRPMRWTTRCCSPPLESWRSEPDCPCASPTHLQPNGGWSSRTSRSRGTISDLCSPVTAILTMVFGMGALGSGGRQALIDMESVVGIAAFLALFRRYLWGAIGAAGPDIADRVCDFAPGQGSRIGMAGRGGLVCNRDWNRLFRCAPAHSQSGPSWSGDSNLVSATGQG